MKKYVNPMLQVVSIANNDIITDSQTINFGENSYNGSSTIEVAGRRGFDDYYEGY